MTFHTNEQIVKVYNIFAMANISAVESLSNLFQAIGQPTRLQILLAIGAEETCVCHLEATFGWRQAYISQHLKALREAGLVLDRRDGRFIFYCLANPAILEILCQFAQTQGIDIPGTLSPQDCDCPKCNPDTGRCR